MQGLSCDEMAAVVPAMLVDEFLGEYRMLRDEYRGVQSKSGITPLLLVVVAGNAVVVQTLARQNPSDVTARIKSDFRMLGIPSGMTPLHLAVTYCSTNHTEIVTSLLEHGAD